MNNKDWQNMRMIIRMWAEGMAQTNGKDELEELLNRQYRRYRMRMNYLKYRLRWKN